MAFNDYQKNQIESDKILADIRNKIYYPIYILEGDEPYYIDLIAQKIENDILTEEEKDFNQTVLFGKETSIGDIVSSARRFPMMADYQVIIVKEAQDLTFTISVEDEKKLEKKIESGKELNASEQNKKAIARLIEYAENPSKSTILVICHKGKTIDGKSRFMKAVAKTGCILKTEQLKDYDVDKWIKDYLVAEKLQFETEVPYMLKERIGTDLQTIVNEITKVRTANQGLTKLTKLDIEKNIVVSKKFSPYELQDAIIQKNQQKIYTMIKYFSENPTKVSLQEIISTLFGFFKNIMIAHQYAKSSNEEIGKAIGLHPFLIQKNFRPAMVAYTPMGCFRVISLLHDYDMKSKGMESGGESNEELLRELIIKITLIH